jgi:hypothetical protein
MNRVQTLSKHGHVSSLPPPRYTTVRMSTRRREGNTDNTAVAAAAAVAVAAVPKYSRHRHSSKVSARRGSVSKGVGEILCSSRATAMHSSLSRSLALHARNNHVQMDGAGSLAGLDWYSLLYATLARMDISGSPTNSRLFLRVEWLCFDKNSYWWTELTWFPERGKFDTL